MARPLKPHFLLDPRAGWRAARQEAGLVQDPGGRLTLARLPGSGRPLADGTGSFGGLTWPTGLAVDRDGRIYVLDSGSHRVRRFDPCSCQFEELPCLGGEGAGPRQLREPRGLAVSPGDDLLVADTGNRRVLIFALKGLVLRRIWGPLGVTHEDGEAGVEKVGPLAAPLAAEPGEACVPAEPSWPEGTWRPWDVAVAGPCKVWVSDPANGLVHRFDLSSPGTIPAWRGAIDSEEGGIPLVRPTHLAVDGRGWLYVVQDGRDYVTIFDREGTFAGRVERPHQVEDRFAPQAVAVDPEGNLYLSCGPCCPGALNPSVRDADGGSRVYFYRRDEPFTNACYRDRAAPVDASCPVLAFDSDGNPLGLAGRRVVVLRPAAAFETEGRFLSEPLDSRIYRCVWHRVVLDARVEPGTWVEVETFTAESPKTAAEVLGLPDSRWTAAARHTLTGLPEWDCLVRSAPGRYLWLRLTLRGDGTAAPEIAAVRLEFPRRSSVEHLPAVYREEPESGDFLDRFLSIFDTLRGEIGQVVGRVALYFDPFATPAASPPGTTDFLTWLASWLGLALDRHWPEAKRRELVAQAHRLYALRGTPRGLALHLRLYTGIEPRILEHFRVRRWLFVAGDDCGDGGGGARLGDCAELWGPDLVDRLQLDEHSRIGSFQLLDSGDPTADPFHHLAHRFTVFVPLGAAASDEQRQTLRRIVEMAKPAHTEAEIEIVEPRLRIGVQSRVGVDTMVGEYPEGVVTGEGSLGQGTLLGPSDDEARGPTLRLGAGARIGSSSLID